jgi:hypothetical protein
MLAAFYLLFPDPSLVTPLRGVTFSLALCAISNMADQGPSLQLFAGWAPLILFSED